MKTQKMYLFATLTFFMFLTPHAFSQPIGEHASYLLDRNPKRTTRMVKKGELVVNISEYTTNENDEGFYKTLFDFDLSISMAGRQQGQETMLITEDYFTPEFWDELREKKYLETPTFKIKHLGVLDTTTISGEEYFGCDSVLFYDIEETGDSFFMNLVHKLSKIVVKSFDGEEIEDLKFKSIVCDGTPAMKATKIDMSGKTRGFNFKVGFDYNPSAN